MKTIPLFIVLAISAFAQAPPATEKKLTAEQKTTIESANQQALIAQYLARIADLERQVATLQIRTTIAEACAAADIKLAECEVKQDGTINKKADKKDSAK